MCYTWLDQFPIHWLHFHYALRSFEVEEICKGKGTEAHRHKRFLLLLQRIRSNFGSTTDSLLGNIIRTLRAELTDTKYELWKYLWEIPIGMTCTQMDMQADYITYM